MIINGQRYEAEPAVEAYVKDLQAENEEQRREILRLTDELKEMDGANEYLRNQSAKDFENVLKFMDTIGALKKENERLEEKYQKATGVIAMDSLPTAVDLYKLKKMCIENQGCRECAFRRENFEGFDRCAFEGLPMDWNFGGVENETD